MLQFYIPEVDKVEQVIINNYRTVKKWLLFLLYRVWNHILHFFNFLDPKFWAKKPDIIFSFMDEWNVTE